MLFEHRRAKKMEMDAPVSGDCEEGCNASVATLVRMLSTLSPGMPAVPFFYLSILETKGFCFFLWLCSVYSGFEMKASRQWWCWLSITFGLVAFFFFLAGTKTVAGLICDSLLPFSHSLCIYIFLVYALFLFCDLLCFWVDFFRPCSRFSSPFYRLPSWLPITSPAFAWLLSSTNEIVGERRGPRLDRIRCRFSICWIGMEKMNTTVPPATAMFQAAMNIFILTLELWKFSNWTSKQLKIPFNFAHLD